MKNKIAEFMLSFYPFVALVGLPIINQSFIRQVQRGQNPVFLKEFAVILLFFIFSVFLFKNVLENLKSFRIYSIGIGLAISLFFAVYTLFPSCFSVIPFSFFKAYFADFSLNLFGTLSLSSIYMVLLICHLNRKDPQ